jgi:hypothetical protein
MVNYLKLEGPRGLFLSEVAYVSCVLAWIYFRLFQVSPLVNGIVEPGLLHLQSQYPFRVLKGSWLDALHVAWGHDANLWGMSWHDLQPPAVPGWAAL